MTIVDYTTRYPEAFAIPSQASEIVADALIELFSRMGIPNEIVSDQGTSFMSQLIQELCTSLGIKKIKSTPYHPETNGLVEKFNGSMKSMLRKFVHDEPKTWDKLHVLPYIMFAYREVPETSTGFAPFELIYGWPIRGPLSIVKENWLDKNANVSIVEYVLKMRSRLAQCLDKAHLQLEKSQTKMKKWYDEKARDRTYEEGEEVLVLLPMSYKCLEITRKLSNLDYEVDTGRSKKRLRVYHANLLKKWKSRSEIVMFSNNEMSLPFPGKTTENSHDVEISEHLNAEQQTAMLKLVQKFFDIFSDKPSRTTAALHHIDTGDARHVRQTAYRIPHALKDPFRTEMQEMLDQNIIEKSNSAWAAPVVIVPKLQDNKVTGIRVCIDYRKLNSMSNFDAFPLPRMEDLVENLGDAKFISKLNLTKGYWQIPLSQETQETSAFITPYCLYQFKVMPFGMTSAPATFQRMIQQVLSGLEQFSGAFLDDVIIYSDTFENHLQHVEAVFQRLRNVNLVAKPSKSELGQAQVKYIGNLVGVGQLRPLRSKIESIEQYPIPETKTQLRQFLGLAGYYRRFIPIFSEIAAPLTDKIGKKQSNRVKWSSACDQAFLTLKHCMTNFPVLQLPDYSNPFI